jgi:hypothetical protein
MFLTSTNQALADRHLQRDGASGLTLLWPQALAGVSVRWLTGPGRVRTSNLDVATAAESSLDAKTGQDPDVQYYPES